MSLDDHYIDFDEGMGKGSGYFRAIERYSVENQRLLQFFRNLYQKYNFRTLPGGTEPRTPRIIHQIWIGRRAIPPHLKAFIESWKQLHPSWEYRLWTNREVEDYQFSLPGLGELFSRKLTMGERVDILRYDILYRYGGIYADCDTLCLRPFEPFVNRYDFFCGLYQPVPPSVERSIFLQNCLIGAKAEHPILKEIANILVHDWDSAGSSDDECWNTLQRTFWTLTDAFVKAHGRDGNIDIALPPVYFMPIHQGKLFDFVMRGPIDVILGMVDSSRAPFSRFRDCSFSHHTSEKEWAFDLYGSYRLGYKFWTLFKLKDWKRFITLRFAAADKVAARTSFSELIDGTS